MLQLLGYPEWVQDEAGIDEYYSGVSEVQNQQLLNCNKCSLFHFLILFSSKKNYLLNIEVM